MRYYKIVKDNAIIDVQNNLQPVRYDDRAGIILRCRLTDNPQGVISSDGQFVWQVQEWPAFPDGFSADVVSLMEITGEEYADLKTKLEENQGTIKPEEPGQEPDPPQEEVMGAVEMRLKIKELSTTVKDLTERNEFLEECLMEISEVVYA